MKIVAMIAGYLLFCTVSLADITHCNGTGMVLVPAAPGYSAFCIQTAANPAVTHAQAKFNCATSQLAELCSYAQLYAACSRGFAPEIANASNWTNLDTTKVEALPRGVTGSNNIALTIGGAKACNTTSSANTVRDTVTGTEATRVYRCCQR